jgi:hypothetical protein
MKYLAFDIEIAFDFSHIDIDLFPPEDGEKVLLANEDSEEEMWMEATYIGNIIKRFKLLNGELIKAPHWKYQGGDWKRFHPLGITCAAASSDGELWNWWANESGRFTDRMIRYDAEKLVVALMKLARGFTILTWNGLGFDFELLAEESGMFEECKELALNHVDMMFHFFCSKGYALGLDAASKGMGLAGKPEGMTGAKAPELWPTDPHKILAYCSLDTKNTLDLANAVDQCGYLEWTARSGRQNVWDCSRWLTVKEAMALTEPDTSWMSDPWTRSKFYGWTGYIPQVQTPVPLPLTPLDLDYDEMEEEERREIEE